MRWRDADLLAEAIADALGGSRSPAKALRAYQKQRDQQSRGMYNFTVPLAALPPPSAAERMLFAAIAERPDQSARYFAGLTCAEPISEFMSAGTLSTGLALGTGEARPDPALRTASSASYSVKYRPRRWASGGVSGPSSMCSIKASTSNDQPTSRGSLSTIRQPTHAGAPTRTGPHSLGCQRPSRNGPPGAGITPAKASESSRWSHPSTLTTVACDRRSALTSSESGSSSMSSRPGFPSATRIDDTVSPAGRSDEYAVQTVTGAGRRPRNRRSSLRSSSGGRNGWSLWIVTQTSCCSSADHVDQGPEASSKDRAHQQNGCRCRAHHQHGHLRVAAVDMPAQRSGDREASWQAGSKHAGDA
jgi:hypothetical protein